MEVLNLKDYKKNWRKKAKEYLAAAFGGSCTICGYNKTITALDYHHIDPTKKEMLLSVACSNGTSWKKIIQEARKCTMVCCRCHREIHAGVTKLPENCVRFNEDYCDIIKLQTKEFDQCPVCGNEKNKKQKFCSSACFKQSSRKFEVSKEELENLIKNNTYTYVGDMFGVSNNAIKKRCKSLGIYLPPRKMQV